MAGHSKWSKIKRQKGINDVQKGAVFAKHSRHITLAVSEGGGITDPEKNVKLRLAIEQASASSMPKATIERAVKNASAQDKLNLKQLYYGAFGPGGCMLYIEALTDNESRTVANVKYTLRKRGGKMGTSGSVDYLFRHCYIVTFSKPENDESDVLSFASKVDAYDIDEDADTSELQSDQPLRDQLDLDSMDFLDIVMELRKRYKLQIPEEDYPELASLDSCVNYLEPKLKEF